jgi:hypothetical protein
MISGGLLLPMFRPAAAGDGAVRPAVVELYTSQGCSSCPPAEKLLGELSRRPDVLAIAFHVDYWDNLGWHDPFSMAQATARQQDFGEKLKLQTVGTPHMIINGERSVFGVNKAAVLQAAHKPRPSSVAVDAGLKLTEVNVARSIRRVGTTSDTAGEWKVPLGSFPNDASRALVMLQATGNGPVASAVSVALR